MRGPKRFDIDQLVADVEEAFKEYPPGQLEKMWRSTRATSWARC